MAGLTSKLVSAVEALFSSASTTTAEPITRFILTFAAATLVGVCLGSLLRRRKGAGATGGSAMMKKKRPMPLRKGYPLIGSTVEVLANLPRFLDWLLDCVCDPELGGSDGLGAWLASVVYNGRWKGMALGRGVAYPHHGAHATPNLQGRGASTWRCSRPSW